MDDYQRAHTWLGAPLAVVYKFFEDRGPYLSALVTYYVFVSVFPLLLVFTSALGFFLTRHSTLHHALLSSALKNFPIIGAQLRQNVSHFHGSGVGLAIGIIVSLYGAIGATQAAQCAFNRMYAVPRNEQPNPFKSRLRSVLLLFLLSGGVLVATGLAIVVSTANQLSAGLGAWLRAVGILVSFLVDAAVFIGAFQLLTARKLHVRQVIWGGLLAALAWELLQTLGTSLIGHELRSEGSVYGTFGLVLSTLAWIYVQALAVMLAAEVNVVVSRRLWPRALLTPFTDKVDLTDADRRTYHLHARTQRFKGFETIETTFGDSEQAQPEKPVAADDPR